MAILIKIIKHEDFYKRMKDNIYSLGIHIITTNPLIAQHMSESLKVLCNALSLPHRPIHPPPLLSLLVSRLRHIRSWYY